MQIRTRQIFKASPEVLWPLLFNSKMDDKQPCYLLCGLPKPLECRLKDSEGGVGKTRECISDKGTIQQTILEWEENRQLSFELSETDIYFGPCIKSIVETFTLQPIDAEHTALTRTTSFSMVAGMKYLIAIPMAIGLKSIHRYVFKNWRRLSSSGKALHAKPQLNGTGTR